MKKRISHKEKLEFYKKFNSTEFNDKLDKMTGELVVKGIVSFLVLSGISLFFGLATNPLYFLGLIPSVANCFIFGWFNKLFQKREISKLTPNIDYKDFKEMQESGEWYKLANEIHGFDENSSYLKQPKISKIKNHTYNDDLEFGDEVEDEDNLKAHLFHTNKEI